MKSIFGQDTWAIGRWEEDGKPHIVRQRTCLPSPEDRERFPNVVVVEWKYKAGPSGLPEHAEHERMQELEDALEQGTEASGKAVQALSLTGAGLKEWRYYTADVKAFMASFQDDVRGKPAFPVDVHFFHDPEWQALAEYLDAGKQAGGPE